MFQRSGCNCMDSVRLLSCVCVCGCAAPTRFGSQIWSGHFDSLSGGIPLITRAIISCVGSCETTKTCKNEGFLVEGSTDF